MYQSTINVWLDNHSENADAIPYYFYLEWTERSHPKTDAYWIKELCGHAKQGKSPSITMVNKFTHRPVILIGNIVPYDIPEKEEYKYKDNPGYNNIHFLKSHLQKCIRRKKTEKAIQTSRHLLEIDPISFLRRLAIILIEDVSPPSFYTTIIWLLVATSSKKFQLSTNHKEWLLGAVYVACNSPYRERFPSCDIKDDQLFSKVIVENKENKYQPTIFSLIMSIFLRIGFGGMKCDMCMLKSHAETWAKRGLIDNIDQKWIKYYHTKVRTISWIVEPLRKEDWEYSAIDFHCYPKMIDWLHSSFPDLENDDIKTIIWENRSSLNVRDYYDPNTQMCKEDNKCSRLITDNEWKQLLKNINRISFYAIKNNSTNLFL